MRKGIYTIYKGKEFQLTRNPKEEYILIARGEMPLDKGFIQSPYASNTFTKIVSSNEINNSFSVITYAQYKGYNFQISQTKGDLFQLSTSEEKAYKELNLEMIDRGYYLLWVHKSKIEKAWEERKPSGYDFPMPPGIEEIKEIVL